MKSLLELLFYSSYRVQCKKMDRMHTKLVKRDAKRYANGDFKILESPDGYGNFVDFCRGRCTIEGIEKTLIAFSIDGKEHYGAFYDSNYAITPVSGQRIKYKKSSSVDYDGKPLYWLDYLSVSDNLTSEA